MPFNKCHIWDCKARLDMSVYAPLQRLVAALHSTAMYCVLRPTQLAPTVSKNEIQIASYSLALVVETASDLLGKQNCTKRQKFSSNRKASFKRALCFVPFTLTFSAFAGWKHGIPPRNGVPTISLPFWGGSKNNDHVLQWRRSAESVDTP